MWSRLIVRTVVDEEPDVVGREFDEVTFSALAFLANAFSKASRASPKCPPWFLATAIQAE